MASLGRRVTAVYQRTAPVPQAFAWSARRPRPGPAWPARSRRMAPTRSAENTRHVPRYLPASARGNARETVRGRRPAEWHRCARRRARCRTAWRGARGCGRCGVIRPMREPVKFGMPAAPLLITVMRPAGSAKSRSAARQVWVEANTSMCEARRIASSRAGRAGLVERIVRERPAGQRRRVAVHDADAQAADIGHEVHRQRGQAGPRRRAAPRRCGADRSGSRSNGGPCPRRPTPDRRSRSRRRYRRRARSRSRHCRGSRDGAPRAGRFRRTSPARRRTSGNRR